MAKLVPIEQERDEIFGFRKGKGRLKDAIVKHAFTLRDWGDLA